MIWKFILAGIAGIILGIVITWAILHDDKKSKTGSGFTPRVYE